MPRPRRSKVASKGTRVVSSSEDAPTSITSKPSKADSMAPLKRPRGGAQKFKPARDVDEIESSGQTAQKRPAKRAKARTVKRKKDLLVDRYVEDDVDEELQASALDALKARLDSGQAGQIMDASNAAVAARQSPEGHSERQRKSSSVIHVPSRQHVSSTPQVQQPHISRGRTPSVQINTDDDLYGLSPAGKASQSRLGPRRSSIPRAPMSVLRVQGTPGMETSILALQNFKRRPRQPSLIRMVQQSSELGKEDEEAYLGTDLDLDETLRDFDNFLPEDESTPLNFGKRKQEMEPRSKQQAAGVDGLSTSSSRKRKRTETEEDVQIPGSGSYGSSPPRIRGTTWARSSQAPSAPEDHIIVSTEEQDPIFAEPVSQIDIIAPPRSSSQSMTPKKRKTRGNRPTERPRRAATQQSKKAPKISTAHLQSLLPKSRAKSVARRARPTATYDIPSDSELDNALDLPGDADELSRPKGRRRASTTRSKKTPLAKKDANKKLSKKSTTPKAKQKRTYGRQVSAGKENDDSVIVHSDEEDEDTIEIVGDEKTAKVKASKSKVLERAREMFAAVDEWEMEFESVDLGGGESSPWR